MPMQITLSKLRKVKQLSIIHFYKNIILKYTTTTNHNTI